MVARYFFLHEPQYLNEEIDDNKIVNIHPFGNVKYACEKCKNVSQGIHRNILDFGWKLPKPNVYQAFSGATDFKSIYNGNLPPKLVPTGKM